MAGPQSGADLAGTPGTPRQTKVVDLPGIQPVTPVRISDDVSEQIRRLIVSENLAGEEDEAPNARLWNGSPASAP